MTRCSAKTASGRRCKSSVFCNDLCFQHQVSCSPSKKVCGHTCVLTTERCCACEDKRPHAQAHYLRYIDGTGMTLPIGCRADGYCVACKPRHMNSNVTVRPKKVVSFAATVAGAGGTDTDSVADAIRKNTIKTKLATCIHILESLHDTV